MSEIYQRGGREELIKAIEQFSRTTKAEMLAATSVACQRAGVEEVRRGAPASQGNDQDMSY